MHLICLLYRTPSNARGGSATSITDHYLPALLMNYGFLIFPCCSLMRAGSFSVTAVCDYAERETHYSFKRYIQVPGLPVCYLCSSSSGQCVNFSHVIYQPCLFHFLNLNPSLGEVPSQLHWYCFLAVLGTMGVAPQCTHTYIKAIKKRKGMTFFNEITQCNLLLLLPASQLRLARMQTGSLWCRRVFRRRARRDEKEVSDSFILGRSWENPRHYFETCQT